MKQSHTGGCQCGAVRFVVEGPLGRASICHCRMCQKAFGAFYGPFVSAPKVRWTRGAPKYFASSNRVRRGFCQECGTPLSFEPEGGDVDIAIGAFDDPTPIEPTIQIGVEGRLPWLGKLDSLPGRSPREAEKIASYLKSIRSRQHPDHDTKVWPEGA